MSNRKQREQNRQNYRQLMVLLGPKSECDNCHELITQGHFVPPSLGEDGFFICEEKKDGQQD